MRWFDEAFSTRLDDKKIGRWIIIEQRTHANDLTSHLLAESGWHHIALPAIAEHKTIIIFPRSHTQRVREEGDILWPAREGPAELEAAKVRLGAFGFAAQYQQAPTARGGNLIKLEWLSATYRALPTRFDSLVLSLDTAYKTGASNDYSAAVVIGVLHRPRDGSPRVTIWSTPGAASSSSPSSSASWLSSIRPGVPTSVLVEDAASGQSLIQELRAGTALPIKPIKPDRDKYARVAAVTPILEARRLLLPEAAWWREDLIAELTSFPAGAHDDWCDALAMALNYLRDEGPARKWITASKLRLASAWVGEGATVEEAAARAELSTPELQDYLERGRILFSESSRFGTPRAPGTAKPEPGNVTQQQRSPSERLAEAQANGRYLDIDPAFFKARTHNSPEHLRIRPPGCSRRTRRAGWAAWMSTLCTGGHSLSRGCCARDIRTRRPL